MKKVFVSQRASVPMLSVLDEIDMVIGGEGQRWKGTETCKCDAKKSSPICMTAYFLFLCTRANVEGRWAGGESRAEMS
jgi:hypothetical protein